MQIWLANIFCLAEKSPWLAVSPPVWVAVNTSASHNAHTCPEQTSILQLTWALIVVRVYKIYCSNIECPIMRDVYGSPESKFGCVRCASYTFGSEKGSVKSMLYCCENVENYGPMCNLLVFCQLYIILYIMWTLHRKLDCQCILWSQSIFLESPNKTFLTRYTSYVINTKSWV